LLKDETELFEEMDDTKVIVNGVEAIATEPTRTDFEALEKDEILESDESSEEEDDDAKENGSAFF
jgi:hypothetical protein